MYSTVTTKGGVQKIENNARMNKFKNPTITYSILTVYSKFQVQKNSVFASKLSIAM